MKPELVAETLEKLIDEKQKLATVLTSKTLGGNKQFFIDDCQKKIAQVRAALVEALR